MFRNWIPVVTLHCLFAGTALSAVGCSSATETTPSGHASLQFSNGSASGLVFVLENGFSEPINFRGYGALPGNVTPDVYSIQCYSEVTKTATAGGSMIKHGGTSPSRIKAMPGEQIHLVIKSDIFERYRGQTCTLALIFGNDSSVTSPEFTVP